MQSPITSSSHQNKSASAVQRIIGFVSQFGELHFELACHAAFPLALTPDLLYQLWAHFVPEASWTAVSDILLSRLCREVSFELYEMDLSLRNLLLQELRENDKYGEYRIRELSRFILEYFNEQIANDDIEETLLNYQRWVPLAYLEPESLSIEIKEAISNISTDQDNLGELFRLRFLVETLSFSLSGLEIYPLLLNYVQEKCLVASRNAFGVTEEINQVGNVAFDIKKPEDVFSNATEIKTDFSTKEIKAPALLTTQNLVDILPGYYTSVDRDLVYRAYEVAVYAHASQKRYTGSPYINHCVAVAAILAEMRMPAEVVAAGLLHDTIEDTTIKLDDLKKQFGDTVANLVDGFTKLDSLPRVSYSDEQSNLEPDSRGKRQNAIEAMLKTFLVMNDDVRVVLIKVADRLHNMRTLGFMPPDKQKRIAQETLDIYAQLASRLGIWQIQRELEDISFRYINPEKYKEISEQLTDRRSTHKDQIAEIVEKLQPLLAQANIKTEISGRWKHVYSIYQKMVAKNKTFEMIRDVRGVRLIVPDLPSCYAVLGLIHNLWRPIPGEFDDYIAAPKDNFYQSLQTVVLYDDGKPLEVQIRTPEMHQNAEYGIAAQWRYKAGVRRDQKYEQHVLWLRSMMEWRGDVQDAQEFVDLIKSDVHDRVYIFTPKGDIYDLPAGSTPIDFAYHVHTDIGHRCRGAKVDGKLVSLDYVLKTGQQVEILTTKRGGPSRIWLNPSLSMATTERARSRIREWFRKSEDPHTAEDLGEI